MTSATGRNGIGRQLTVVLALWVIYAAGLTPVEARPAEPSPLRLSEAPCEPTRGMRREFESEHRPVPVRRYRLVSEQPFGDLKALVRRPDGKLDPVRIEPEQDAFRLSFKTPLGDGPFHGVHNLYAIDRQVADDRLIVRVAKWHTIHHSCAWGHDYKYDPDKIQAHSLDSIPLEISCQGLWDRNLHAGVRSGDWLRFQVLSYGVPVPGAAIRLTSGRGWTRQDRTAADGSTAFQLIRDYYPQTWNEFNSRHRERFTVTARFEVHQQGRFKGKDYNSVVYTASLPWTYYPSRKDYMSQAIGLFIGLFVLTAAAFGVFAHRQRRSRPYQEVIFSEKN